MLNEGMKGAVTIELRSLFQNLTTRIEKDDFRRRRRLAELWASDLWPYWQNIKEGSISNAQENTLHVTMSPPRRRRLSKKCRPSQRWPSLNAEWWQKTVAEFIPLITNAKDSDTKRSIRNNYQAAFSDQKPFTIRSGRSAISPSHTTPN